MVGEKAAPVGRCVMGNTTMESVWVTGMLVARPPFIAAIMVGEIICRRGVLWLLPAANKPTIPAQKCGLERGSGDTRSIRRKKTRALVLDKGKNSVVIRFAGGL